MLRKLIYIFIFGLVFAPACDASMKLYISDDCGNCKLVMKAGANLISGLEKKKELEVVDVTRIRTDLPGLPALVDDKKVIIGTGILRYLADKTGFPLKDRGNDRLLNDCPECPSSKNMLLLGLKEKILNAKNLSWPLVVAGLGLIDGINPCAFTTAIFLVGFLAFAGHKRKQIALISSLFILGVFITYLLLGLGFLSFLAGFKYLPHLSHIMTLAAAAFSLVFAVLSLYDWYRYKGSQDPRGFVLKLPGAVTKKIHFLVTSNLRFKTPSLLAASVLLGAGISILESLCTGQMYLPTLALISGDSAGTRFFSLFLYNLMFIVPLIGVSSLGFLGINTGHISRFFIKNLGRIKLLTASVFCGLAVFLIAGLK